MSLERIADELLSVLAENHPLGYEPRLTWRNYRVSAGMAYYREGVIGLSRKVISNEGQLIETLVHEYAHLLAVSRHGRTAAGHGPHWKQAMVDLGAEPRVCHAYPVTRNAKRREVAYRCQRCGFVLIRSRKLPKRRRYSHVGCGGVVKYAWTREVTPEPAVA